MKNVLCFVSCVLCFPVAVALATEQPVSTPVLERNEGTEHPVSSMEVQGYVALCKAVYWERMGYQAIQREERLENYVEAKKQLISAVRVDPDSSFLYAKLAEVLIHLRDYREAAIACEKALKLNPHNADAHYSRGLSLLGFVQRDRRALRGAMEEFKKAAELNPEHLGAQSYLARLLFQDEDYSGAARAYSEIVKQRPYDPELRYQLGISYSRSGETAEAIREFNAAAKLRRNYMEPHFHLAYLYAHQSRNKAAIEECLIFLEADPENPDINLLLAELYVSIAEFDKAILRARKAMRPGKRNRTTVAEAHYRLAAAYKGKEEDGLADLHFQESIDIYREILEEQENVGVHYDIAMVYDAKGDLALAEQHLRRHIELRPDEPNAYNFLGYMFAEHDMNLEEAAALIKKAVAMQPQNGAFRDSLGWAYFKLGDLDDAIAELEKAAEFMPDDGEIREHLGEAYLKKAREAPAGGYPYIEKAILEWEKALEIEPKNLSLQQRLEGLRRSLDQMEDSGKGTE